MSKLKRGRRIIPALVAMFVAGSTLAQGTIEVRSARISMRNADVAAQTLSREDPWLRTIDSPSGAVVRYPTVVLGRVTYTMASSPAVDVPTETGDPGLAATDLLPGSFNGDSLANIPENFPGDPTQAGTIDDSFLPGTVTTDSLRFTAPLTSPLVGVAGPGSSPGVAGPGFISTQGVVSSGSLFGTGISGGAGITTPSTGSRSLRGGRR